MSLEAIAALLGHRSPRMTLVYANPRKFHLTRAKIWVSWSGWSPNTSGGLVVHRR
jgi:hypothetical protein